VKPRKFIEFDGSRNPGFSDGELAIVRLFTGKLRAAFWLSTRPWSDFWRHFVDRHGDGIDGVVAAGRPS
jgi:hypothetical protein